MYKRMVLTAIFLAGLAVILGAFGAHTLDKMISEEALNTFEVGVRYQMYHALAMLFIGLAPVLKNKTKQMVWWCFTTGVLLFSGSIYLLSLKEVLTWDVSAIGFITPIGGLFFIIGWVLFFIKIAKLK